MLATVWMRPDQVDRAASVSRTLTAELERLDGVSRVISPTSLEVLQEDAQGLFFASLGRRHRLDAAAGTAAASSGGGQSARAPAVSGVVLPADQGAHRTVDARHRAPAAGRRRPARARHASGGRGVGRGRHGGPQRRPEPPLVARLPDPRSRNRRRGVADAPGDAAVPVAHDAGGAGARRPHHGRTRGGHAALGTPVHDGHDRAAGPLLHPGHRLEPARRGLDCHMAPGRARHRRRARRGDARPSWRARPSSPTSRRRSASACWP